MLQFSSSNVFYCISGGFNSSMCVYMLLKKAPKLSQTYFQGGGGGGTCPLKISILGFKWFFFLVYQYNSSKMPWNIGDGLKRYSGICFLQN